MRKTFNILLTLCLGCTLLHAEEKLKVTILGTAPKGVESLTVNNATNNFNCGTVHVENGQFCYTGKVAKDSYLIFVSDNKRYRNYVITDGENITLDMTKDIVTGTPMNDSLYKKANEIYKLNAACNHLTKEICKAESTERASELKARRDEAQQKFLKSLRAILDEDNCLTPFFLSQYMYNMPFNEVTEYAGKTKYSKHTLIQIVNSYIEHEAPHQNLIGKSFKDVTIKDGAQQKHKLSEHIGQGQYVLVDFWASWCGPCMREIPFLRQAYDKYKEKGLQIIGISLDQDRNKWIQAVSRQNMSWPQYCSLERFNCPAAVAYNVKSIPWNFLCDKDGTIIAVGLRGDNLLYTLDELIK